MIKQNSNINEVVGRLISKLQSVEKGGELSDSILREVATTMRAEMTIRIHSEGKNANDSDIGQYSTTPMYVSISSNPGRSFGRPIGKTGKSKFASTGLDHTSRYFSDGYSGFKTAIGRNQLGKVNLSLSGQLSNQFHVIAKSEGYGLGWSNDEMIQRAGYLQEKYGKVWSLTETEKTLTKEIAQRHLNSAFNN